MRSFQTLVIAFGLLSPHLANAGIYADDLSRCMVESTTEGDRTDLVVWMFAAASTHSAVKPLSNVSPGQIEQANQTMAALVTRLLTESCLDSARKAFQYEGAVAFQAAMQIVGQVAGQQLFSSPEVTAAMSGLDRHFDSEGVQEVLKGE